jgi:Holliday junction DNA helicase RuvA
VIASIAGEVTLRRPDHVVVETAGGVGYRLSVSAETLRQVAPVGGSVSLLTHLAVRDDAMVLYGFATVEERELFELLISVQGVGPKVALAVLGLGTPREVVRAIAAGDARKLQGAPGVGKRVAERIVAELREKVGVDLPDDDGAPIVVARTDEPHELARAGLLELGYEPGEADRLLSGADGETAEELLAQRGLADELLEPAGTQRAVEVLVGEQRRRCLDPVGRQDLAPRSAADSSSSAVSPSAPASSRSASPGS